MSEPTTTTPAPTLEEVARTVTAHADRLYYLSGCLSLLEKRLEALDEQVATLWRAVRRLER